MCTILELWDIHEHNARIIIDKKFILKKDLYSLDITSSVSE